jgi:hypothetical protein
MESPRRPSSAPARRESAGRTRIHISREPGRLVAPHKSAVRVFPDRTRHKPQTDLDRREFLGSFLGILFFWRRRRVYKLAGIEFRKLQHHRAHRRYLLIHGNEQTARAVLADHMRTAKGTAWLVENTTRNVPFRGGELDPNRMFSREGAGQNLRKLDPDWSQAQILSGLVVLDRTRHQVLDAVRPERGDVLIAVHNNTEYSVNDEVAASNRVALNDRENPHDFCLATDEHDFDLLAHGPYNVVLQNHPAGPDDGSLSRYAVRAGFRYVNIEVGLGKADKQRDILEWVDRTLPRT